jgi:histidinol phosphatase-like PHP family hydrolase
MRLPVFKIWGHALGRLILRRDPIACDVEAVLDAAAVSRTAIEISGDPYRLDLPPAWIPAARRRGTAAALLPAFIAAIGKHRAFERQLDPPEV